MSHLNKLTVLLLIAVMVLLSACSPKQTSRWVGSDYSKEIGAIPDDVCMLNGQPLILGASSESDGGFILVYVRNNGDIVSHQWLTDPVAGITMGDAGEFYWTGGSCPNQ